MARIRNQYLETFKRVAEILHKQEGSLLESEVITLESFCKIIEELEEQNAIIAERTRKSMQEYRSTPEGYERSKKSRRESAARTRAQRKEGKTK